MPAKAVLKPRIKNLKTVCFKKHIWLNNILFNDDISLYMVKWQKWFKLQIAWKGFGRKFSACIDHIAKISYSFITRYDAITERGPDHKLSLLTPRSQAVAADPQITSCRCWPPDHKLSLLTSKAVAAEAIAATEDFFHTERVVVVALLFYVHGKHLRSCRDGQLT